MRSIQSQAVTRAMEDHHTVSDHQTVFDLALQVDEYPVHRVIVWPRETSMRMENIPIYPIINLH